MRPGRQEPHAGNILRQMRRTVDMAWKSHCDFYICVRRESGGTRAPRFFHPPCASFLPLALILSLFLSVYLLRQRAFSHSLLLRSPSLYQWPRRCLTVVGGALPYDGRGGGGHGRRPPLHWSSGRGGGSDPTSRIQQEGRGGGGSPVSRRRRCPPLRRIQQERRRRQPGVPNPASRIWRKGRGGSGGLAAASSPPQDPVGGKPPAGQRSCVPATVAHPPLFFLCSCSCVLIVVFSLGFGSKFDADSYLCSGIFFLGVGDGRKSARTRWRSENMNLLIS